VDFKVLAAGSIELHQPPSRHVNQMPVVRIARSKKAGLQGARLEVLAT